MSWWLALILGVLQGLTEFLPVSSSGHLALAQLLAERLGGGFQQPGVVFDSLLHVGTACAVIYAERKEILRWLQSGWRFLALLVAGTLATGVFAFPLRHFATDAFANPLVIGVCLMVTGLLVLSTRWLGRGSMAERDMGFPQALFIGLLQGLAIFPGLSRSGTTIAAGLGVGLERRWAARFSFLLSVPAILGATAVELMSHREVLDSGSLGFWGPAILGAAVAALTGYVALRLVIRMVSSKVFDRFAWYCLPLGLIVLLWGLLG